MFSAQRVKFTIFALCLVAPWTLLWLDASLLFPYETGKAWLFRAIVELAFGLLVYQQIVSSSLNIFQNTRSQLLLALLATFLVCSFLTAFTGVDAYRSVWSNYERMAGWIAYLHWAMYLLCLVAVLNPTRTKLLLSNLIIVISIICLLGMFESEKRIISTLGNPIYLGNLAVLGLFLLGFLVSGRLRDSNKNRVLIIVTALGVMLVMGLALVNAASRGPFLALATGLLAFTIMMLSGVVNEFKFRTKVIVLAGVLFIVGGLVLQLDAMQNLFKQSDNYALQRIGRISMQDQTTADRLENWRIALDAAGQHPLLGWGQENYAIAFTEHYRAGVMDYADIWFDRAHNAYLDVLIASGIPGLVLYCLMLGLALLIALRISSWSSPQKAFAIGFLVAFMAKNLVGMDTFSSTLLWISFIAVILVRSDPSFPAISETRSLYKSILILPILALSLLSAYWLNIKPYMANQHLASAIDYPAILGQNTFGQWMEPLQNNQRIGINARLAVLDQLLTQTHDNPVTATEAANHADLLQRAGELITTELEHQPRNYRIKYNGSLLLARLGHYDLAIKLLEELTQSAPKRTVFWHSLAQVYAAAGDDASAARVNATINQLNPNWRP